MDQHLIYTPFSLLFSPHFSHLFKKERVKDMDKLTLLAEIEGFDDVMDLLEESSIDSVVPGICMSEDCEYTTEVEPDQREGYCEECDKGSVKSCHILAGII